MSEIIHENARVSNLPSNLEDLLYQFIKLYDSWSLEQKMVGKREAEMSKSIENFNQKMIELDKLHGVIEKKIQEAAQKSTDVIAKSAGNDAQKYIRTEVNTYVDHLSRCITRAEQAMPVLNKLEEENAIKMVIIIALVSFLLGCGAGAWWISSSTVTVEKLYTLLHKNTK